eukprot:EG_transcript_19601
MLRCALLPTRFPLRSSVAEQVAYRSTKIKPRRKALHDYDSIENYGNRNRWLKKHRRGKWAHKPTVEQRFEVRTQPMLPPVPKFFSLRDHVTHAPTPYYDPRKEVDTVLERVLQSRRAAPLGLTGDAHAVATAAYAGRGFGVPRWFAAPKNFTPVKIG